KAFDQLFDIYEGEKVPALSGIREAYAVATGDYGITGLTPPERVREADVTTSSFSFLLGTSMNKRLLKDYQAWPSEWQKFCTITPIKDFKQQDRIRLGAFGSLSTVVTPGTVNTGVALSSSAMQTGVTAMRRQTNLASKPIGLKPRFLVVPPELEWTAIVITKSAGAPGANYNDINPMLGYCEVIVAPQLASA